MPRCLASRFKFDWTLGIVLEEPQNAGLDVMQQPHPEIEHFGADLEGIVQAGEDEASSRQSRFGAARRFPRNRALPVARQISVRQIDDLLACSRPGFPRGSARDQR